VYVDIKSIFFSLYNVNELLASWSSWRSIENKRKFFENYAKANDFDPHDPENWYKQPHRKISAFKVHSLLLSSHIQEEFDVSII
jgi:hypothetical protein